MTGAKDKGGRRALRRTHKASLSSIEPDPDAKTASNVPPAKLGRNERRRRLEATDNAAAGVSSPLGKRHKIDGAVPSDPLPKSDGEGLCQVEEVPKSGERPSLEDAEGSAKERLVTIEEEAAPSGASAPAAWKVPEWGEKAFVWEQRTCSRRFWMRAKKYTPCRRSPRPQWIRSLQQRLRKVLRSTGRPSTQEGLLEERRELRREAKKAAKKAAAKKARAATKRAAAKKATPKKPAAKKAAAPKAEKPAVKKAAAPKANGLAVQKPAMKKIAAPKKAAVKKPETATEMTAPVGALAQEPMAGKL